MNVREVARGSDLRAYGPWAVDVTLAFERPREYFHGPPGEGGRPRCAYLYLEV